MERLEVDEITEIVTSILGDTRRNIQLLSQALFVDIVSQLVNIKACCLYGLGTVRITALVRGITVLDVRLVIASVVSLALQSQHVSLVTHADMDNELRLDSAPLAGHIVQDPVVLHGDLLQQQLVPAVTPDLLQTTDSFPTGIDCVVSEQTKPRDN